MQRIQQLPSAHKTLGSISSTEKQRVTLIVLRFIDFSELYTQWIFSNKNCSKWLSLTSNICVSVHCIAYTFLKTRQWLKTNQRPHHQPVFTLWALPPSPNSCISPGLIGYYISIALDFVCALNTSMSPPSCYNFFDSCFSSFLAQSEYPSGMHPSSLPFPQPLPGLSHSVLLSCLHGTFFFWVYRRVYYLAFSARIQ